MLSLLVAHGRLKDKDVKKLCSDYPKVKQGDSVFVSVKGNVKKVGVAGTIGADTIVVLPKHPNLHPRKSALGSSSPASTNQCATAGVEVETPTGEDVPIANVMHGDAVICTDHQIKAAKVHAKSTYPGAKCEPVITREPGISEERAVFVAKFMRSDTVVESVDASLANAAKGVKYRLKQRRFPLWRRLCNVMVAAKLKPVSWGYFWGLTSDKKQYELVTADNCCCGTCRDLGFQNYEELREIIKLLAAAIERVSNDTHKLESSAELLKRVDKEEEYRSTIYRTHLKNEDACASHCLTYLLSSANDRRFCKQCTHTRTDGTIGETPETWDAYHRRGGHLEDKEDPQEASGNKRQKKAKKPQGRAAVPQDWNDQCECCAGVAGKTEEIGVLYKCSYCNVVAHKQCIERTHNDLDGKEDWTCWDCSRDLGALNHDSSCNQCNEHDDIANSVRRGIDVLKHFESIKSSSSNSGSNTSSSSSSIVRESQMFEARMQEFEIKERKYHAHLIRDRNQECAKELAQETLTYDSFYVLMDYWAKINAQKSSTAVCEGNQVGISAHGMMFVYPNPTVAERAEIDRKHGKIDWEKFGPAPEDGGTKLLEEHFNIFCDDAKQDAFHTKSEIDATFDVFLEGRPWLKVAHRAVVQSDQAGNYRDPTTDIDMVYIGTRIFSEPGMGKNEGDRNGADNKSGIRRYRDERHGLESANDVLDGANSLELKAQTNGILSLNRCNQGKGRSIKRKPVPGISNYSVWSVTPEVITFWESLDIKASYESMLVTGQAVGFGPGYKISIAEFNKEHRTGAAETGASLSFGEGKGTPEPNPKQRQSKGEKQAASDAKKQRDLDQQQFWDAKDEAKSAQIKADYANAVHMCPRCHLKYTSPGWFSAHTSRWCVNKEAARRERMERRHVPLLLAAYDDLAVAEYAHKVAALSTAKVILKARKGFTEAGIDFKLIDGKFIVADLQKTGLAFLSAKIGKDWVLSDIDGAVANAAAVVSLKCIPIGNSIELLFVKPSPEIPYPGAARMAIHKAVQFVLHPDQLAWLQLNAFADGKPLNRPKEVWRAMKGAFHSTMRTDTMTPMWLEQGRIEDWVAKQVKSAKEERKIEKKAAAPPKEASTPAQKKKRSEQSSSSKTKVKASAAKKKQKPNDSSVEEESGSNGECSDMSDDEGDETE